MLPRAKGTVCADGLCLPNVQITGIAIRRPANAPIEVIPAVLITLNMEAEINAMEEKKPSAHHILNSRKTVIVSYILPESVNIIISTSQRMVAHANLQNCQAVKVMGAD